MEYQPISAEGRALYESRSGYMTSVDFQGVEAIKDGEIMGVIGFDHWTPSSAQGHVLIVDARCLSGGGILREAFGYAFGAAGRLIVFASTPSFHEDCLKFSDSIGFKEIYRVKDGWDIGVDMVIKEMRKTSCPWIEESV